MENESRYAWIIWCTFCGRTCTQTSEEFSLQMWNRSRRAIHKSMNGDAMNARSTERWQPIELSFLHEHTISTRASCLWMWPTAILSINNNKDFGEIGNYIRCAVQNVTLSLSLKSSHAVLSRHECFFAPLNNWWALVSILTNLGIWI